MLPWSWFRWLWFTPAVDLSLYPDCTASPYRLPWPAGQVRVCVQSNDGILSHFGIERFAYDFAMPVGSPVCAARAGVVNWVEVDHDGRWFTAPNNFIRVDHGDGTAAWYVHLMKDGSEVEIGEPVEQGQLLGYSGNVGRSLMPHLHFDVTGPNGATIPITFADVPGDGIPRTFRRYRSGNGLIVA